MRPAITRQAQGLEALEAGARGYVHALANAEVLHRVATVVTHEGLWAGAELVSGVVGASFSALGGPAGSQQGLECLSDPALSQRGPPRPSVR